MMPAEPDQAIRFGKARSAQSGALLEDYVELISDLHALNGEARATDIARRLGVSHATVIKTVGRLKREGLAVAKPYRGVFLTERGEHLAARFGSRHRVVVDLLLAVGGRWSRPNWTPTHRAPRLRHDTRGVRQVAGSQSGLDAAVDRGTQSRCDIGPVLENPCDGPIELLAGGGTAAGRTRHLPGRIAVLCWVRHLRFRRRVVDRTGDGQGSPARGALGGGRAALCQRGNDSKR
jgi:DtxR family manganese transport transcriptional regulator